MPPPDIYIAGIDPGLDGAICIYNLTQRRLHTCEAPPTFLLDKARGKGQKRHYDEPGLSQQLQPCHPLTHIFIERQAPLPQQGVASTFTTGYGFGLYKGIIASLRCQCTVVTPAQWKRELLTGMPKGKGSSVLRATQLFPEAAANGTFKGPRGRALDGPAEAALIAYYGATKLQDMPNLQEDRDTNPAPEDYQTT